MIWQFNYSLQLDLSLKTLAFGTRQYSTLLCWNRYWLHNLDLVNSEFSHMIYVIKTQTYIMLVMQYLWRKASCIKTYKKDKRLNKIKTYILFDKNLVYLVVLQRNIQKTCQSECLMKFGSPVMYFYFLSNKSRHSNSTWSIYS